MLEKKKEVGQPVNGVKTAVAKQKMRPQAPPMTGKGAAAAAAAAAVAPAPAQPSAAAAQPSSSSSSSGAPAPVNTYLGLQRCTYIRDVSFLQGRQSRWTALLCQPRSSAGLDYKRGA